MNPLIRDLLPIATALAAAIAGYLTGRYDGYAKAVKDHLDNLERQKTKNWYKTVRKGGLAWS